ncbi:MAG: nitroreductase family protein [Chloroflexi bacterium]|nr:nitroreductase family protein [Chloroflexota bacterium]
MDAAELLETMRTRRSIRRYEDRPISHDVLCRLLEAGRWGPSAHNRQPCRFAVITDPARRVDLAQAMGRRFQADLLAEGLPVEQVEAQVARSIERISTAPALILACLSMAEMDQYSDAVRQQSEYLMAAQSVALAVQNILLMAHAEKLGACWLCAPLFCPDVVRESLHLPADWQAQALLTLGYPAEQRFKDREPFETKTLWY